MAGCGCVVEEIGFFPGFTCGKEDLCGNCQYEEFS